MFVSLNSLFIIARIKSGRLLFRLLFPYLIKFPDIATKALWTGFSKWFKKKKLTKLIVVIRIACLIILSKPVGLGTFSKESGKYSTVQCTAETKSAPIFLYLSRGYGYACFTYVPITTNLNISQIKWQCVLDYSHFVPI